MLDIIIPITFEVFKCISLLTFLGFICASFFLDDKKCKEFAGRHMILFMIFLFFLLFGMTFFIIDLIAVSRR